MQTLLFFRKLRSVSWLLGAAAMTTVGCYKIDTGEEFLTLPAPKFPINQDRQAAWRPFVADAGGGSRERERPRRVVMPRPSPSAAPTSSNNNDVRVPNILINRIDFILIQHAILRSIETDNRNILGGRPDVIIEWLNQENFEVTPDRFIPDEETTMLRGVNENFKEFIGKLRIRYPDAVSHAEIAFEEINRLLSELVKEYNANVLEKKSMPQDYNFKLEAAMRFVRRVGEAFGNDENCGYRHVQTAGSLQLDEGTDLTVKGVISLAWSAINDKNFFPKEQDRDDAKRGLIESFARIQRAHNEEEDGSIIWDNHKHPDQPSCAVGTFQRILESLDNNFLMVTRPTNQQVTNEIREQHQLIFETYDKQHQDKIISGFREVLAKESSVGQGAQASSNNQEEFEKYKRALKNEVQTIAPLITDDQYNDVLGTSVFQALLNVYED